MSAADDYPHLDRERRRPTRTGNEITRAFDEIDRLRAQMAAMEWPGPFTPDEVNEAET